MAKLYITNNSALETLEFSVKSGGVVGIAPGETDYIELVDPNAPIIIANVHAGLISVSEKDPRSGSDKVPPTQTVSGSARAPSGVGSSGVEAADTSPMAGGSSSKSGGSSSKS